MCFFKIVATVAHDRVAGGLAEAIDDVLDAVELDHREAERVTVALVAAELGLDALVERAAIREAGQRIVQVVVARPRIRGHAVQRDRDDLREPRLLLEIRVGKRARAPGARADRVLAVEQRHDEQLLGIVAHRAALGDAAAGQRADRRHARTDGRLVRAGRRARDELVAFAEDEPRAGRAGQRRGALGDDAHHLVGGHPGGGDRVLELDDREQTVRAGCCSARFAHRAHHTRTARPITRAALNCTPATAPYDEA